MKQLFVYGPDEVRFAEVDAPEPGPRDAVVRVAACGICGTDLRYIRQGGLIGPSEQPMAIGHELSGVVARIGADVTDLEVGARVVLNPTALGHSIGNGGSEGGFTRELLVRDAAAGNGLFSIPEELPDDLAALAEPLGVGMNAVNRSEAKPGEKIAVVGAGPIGLAAIATLADRGVEDIVAIDLSPRRLEIAAALGARATINAAEVHPWKTLRELHGESPVLGTPMAATDAYIEASGASALIPKIVRHAKAEARLVVVALHGQDVPISFLTVMMKQMTIRGAMEYPSDYTDTLALLSRRDLSPMITHRFPLERFEEALAVARDPQAGAKVMIEVG